MSSLDDPAPKHVYGNISVEVARLIDRKFFNAIGSTELELIGQEIALQSDHLLLTNGASSQ